MIKKIKKYLATVIALLLLTIIFLGWWLFSAQQNYPATIYIEAGEPFYKIVVKLKDREIIESPWLFSKIGILIGLDRKVIPGRYDFEKKISPYGILTKMWHGKVTRMNFTIPEGYNLHQIGQLLNRRYGTDRQSFDSLARDSLFLLQLGIEAGFGEGYLFPETYNFQWGVTAEEAIRTMVAEMFSRTDSLRARCQSMGYTFDQWLTMASIIELEGSSVEEFGTIASVYRNRFEIKMKLQADPTVIYGMGGLDRDLRLVDYKFPSFYNTYLHKGLPPTPICSPGINALWAALYPDSTEYLYFVADGNGRHVFSETYKQHLSAIRKVKRGK